MLKLIILTIVFISSQLSADEGFRQTQSLQEEEALWHRRLLSQAEAAQARFSAALRQELISEVLEAVRGLIPHQEYLQGPVMRQMLQEFQRHGNEPILQYLTLARYIPAWTQRAQAEVERLLALRRIHANSEIEMQWLASVYRAIGRIEEANELDRIIHLETEAYRRRLMLVTELRERRALEQQIRPPVAVMPGSL